MTTRKLLVASTTSLVVALLAAGCGQITGLSDDYTFDLEDAAADGGRDGGGDAATSQDAGPACKSTATNYLNGEGTGSAACRTCVGTSCCVTVNACSQSSECRNDLKCVIACSSSDGARQSCVAKCEGNTHNAFAPLLQCMQQNCTAQCF